MLLCLPFTNGALKGHFGKVRLQFPPLSVVVKVLCLQHVREVDCQYIRECEVSIYVRCNDPRFHTANVKLVSKPGSNRFQTVLTLARSHRQRVLRSIMSRRLLFVFD